LGRLRKANQFYEAAVFVEDELPDAAVDLFVDAGIAAADVICCARLGMHAMGDNHNEATSLLKKAESSMEKHLRTLLNLKTKVTYTHQSVTSAERTKAGRAAEALVEAARKISSTG
jgi:hypothetical protein